MTNFTKDYIKKRLEGTSGNDPVKIKNNTTRTNYSINKYLAGGVVGTALLGLVGLGGGYLITTNTQPSQGLEQVLEESTTPTTPTETTNDEEPLVLPIADEPEEERSCHWDHSDTYKIKDYSGEFINPEFNEDSLTYLSRLSKYLSGELNLGNDKYQEIEIYGENGLIGKGRVSMYGFTGGLESKLQEEGMDCEDNDYKVELGDVYRIVDLEQENNGGSDSTNNTINRPIAQRGYGFDNITITSDYIEGLDYHFQTGIPQFEIPNGASIQDLAQVIQQNLKFEPGLYWMLDNYVGLDVLYGAAIRVHDSGHVEVYGNPNYKLNEHENYTIPGENTSIKLVKAEATDYSRSLAPVVFDQNLY